MKSAKKTTHTTESRLTKKHAQLISYIFEPMLVLTILTIVGSLVSGMDTMHTIRFVLVFLFAMVLPSLLLRFIALKEGWISNWDVTNRRERIKPMIIFSFIIVTSYFLDMWFGNPFLMRLFALYAVWFIGFFCVTVFWKISGHLGILALACSLLIQWFGMGASISLLSLPLVAWARIKHHDHTLAQTVAGSLYSMLLVFIFSQLV